MKNITIFIEKNKLFYISILSLVCLSFLFLLINFNKMLRLGKIYQPEVFVGESMTCDTTFDVIPDTATPTPTPPSNPPVQSFKKGVAGGATLQALNQLNASWFFNWAYFPVYKDNSINWDAQVWQKFVPLFYGNAYASAASNINKICTKRPEYCNGGYYLVGNEPDNAYIDSKGNGEDGKGMSVQQQITNNVERYGLIMKAIKAKDANAKFIVLGLTSLNLEFTRAFLTKWSIRWAGDPMIASFYSSIQGIQVHTYSNYFECPTNDQGIRDYMIAINFPQGKEFWVTEMGTLGTVPNPNDTSSAGRTERERFKQRMRCLTNVYKDSPLVTRYAWFYFGCNTAVHNFCTTPFASYNLMYPSGNGFSMSDLGLLYSLFPK